jgi:nucleotidyltransferase substrate binding protein (TIGR01987 family)
MSRLSIEAMERSVVAIEQGFVDYKQHPDLLSIRDGIIQRFEIAMGLSWKLLQRFLKECFDVDTDRLRSKKDIFREVAVKGLIEDVEQWLVYYEARNNTSYIYDSELAERTFKQVELFLPDVHKLMVNLKNVD